MYYPNPKYHCHIYHMETVIEIQVTTNFVNPSYPGFDSNTGSCSFNLRLHSDVCQVVKIMIISLRHGEDIHGEDE